MTTSAVLKVECSSEAACASLDSVLAPDNEGAPSGLVLKSLRNGKSLEFTVTADRPSRVIATGVALLRDAGLFQEVWLLSRKAGG